MQGKTVIVTGATSGIGLVTAQELARLGAQTVIISRNPQKCATVVEQIKTSTGNQNIEFIAADLSSHAGVSQAASEFKKRHARLDVLVNNAGALVMKRQVSEDGIEMTFALNHLNYFHLTNLLLDTLKASAPTRIINVSSEAHRGERLDFEDLQCERRYEGLMVYGRSKLANLYFTYELARKLEGTKVTANAVHPGFVATGFAKNNGPLYRVGMSLIGPFIRQPKEGAKTSIRLASSPEVEGISGKYFINSKPVDSDPVSYDQTAAARLWQVSLEMTA